MNNYEKIKKIKNPKDLANFLENDENFFNAFFDFEVEEWLESKAD